MEEQDNIHRIVADIPDGKGSDGCCRKFPKPAPAIIAPCKVCRTPVSSQNLPRRYELPTVKFRSTAVPDMPVYAQKYLRITCESCRLAGYPVSDVRKSDQRSDF